ncbi:hypothetical protein BGZ51_005406 [Haplosporangium sp. Z 767]|nr:hypothetical protein BGZ51_005406 [Haplosporangium sp. Z 767]
MTTTGLSAPDPLAIIPETKSTHANVNAINSEHVVVSSSNGNVSCNGLHDKTQVRVKLQNISQSTKPAKNLGDHTHQTFDFQTTVHNMTFDIVKIDVFDVKKTFGQNIKIGRAYLSLRDLQKRVGNIYDNDGDDNTEPEQSVLSTKFDAEAFCKKHDDVFEVDLPLFKHGSYSKFGSNSQQHNNPAVDKDMIVTTGSENGEDIAAVADRCRRPTRSDSFVQMAMNGIEVGMVTVQATLHFKDQTKNPLFAHLGAGFKGDGHMEGASASGANGQKSTQVNGMQPARSQSNNSIDSFASFDSSTLGESRSVYCDCVSDLGASPPSEQESTASVSRSTSTSTAIPTSNQLGNQQSNARILQVPSSPPNLTLRYGTGSTAELPLPSPLSPIFTQTPGSPTSATASFPWNSDINYSKIGITSWEESELSHCEEFTEEDDSNILSALSDGRGDQVKGENPTQADRDHEEELMADIMANGDQAKKDMYLDRSHESQLTGKHPKGKRAKFSFFSEQTRSAFKDIQLMYSSFFGHGWNLTRSEFWRGFHIVEQYYARHPTPTTNKAFDNIEILEHARHFIRLAIASYGSLPWVYFGYSFKVAPLNFVRFNSDRKNVQDYFKLKKEDMIVWHFDKRTALVPSYYIVRDTKYNALCIIIRGTFSITDAMTDLVCEYYPYKGGLVHKGIMDNARFVLERSGKDIEAALKKFNLRTIYCIGHSLGAGSASLLCSLLQDRFADYIVPATPELPQQKLEVKAYLFAPPPICTPNLAAAWERTQIAFINENDIVCRLSYGNALDLKELIKIGAIESLNPIYNGLDPKEKLDRIIKVLEEAQEKLRAVDDIPRLVTAGTVTYLHKVYEDTPVVDSKRNARDSKFGLPESWSDELLTKTGQDHNRDHAGRSRGSTISSTVSQSSGITLSRSLSVLTSALKSQKRRNTVSSVMVANENNTGVNGSIPRVPKVTPYQPNQPQVRLESSTSLTLSDLNLRHLEQAQTDVRKPQEAPSVKAGLGKPILYDGASNARELTTRSILDKSHKSDGPTPEHQNDATATATSQDNGVAADETVRGGEEQEEGGEGRKEEEEDGYEEDEEEEEEERKVYTTKKPRKNGSKKKEIRIEYSSKDNFTAIPLRANWLWHHFPQQYDSRIERALAWAKAHKAKEEKKQQQQQRRQASKRQQH